MEYKPEVITLLEMREALATSCLEGIYKDRELMEIYMNGFTGYNNETDADIVDYYTQTWLSAMDVEDEEPVEVLTVMDDKQTKVLYRIIQHQQSFDVKVEA